MPGRGVNTYLLNLALSVLPVAWAAVLFMRLARRDLRLDDRESLGLTLLLCFGTFLFPYATQLWGHVTAAAFIIGALYFWLDESRRAAAWSGALIGLAVLAEYSAAIPLLAMALALALSQRWSRLGAFVIGGLPALFFHGIYHQAAFGNAFSLASFYNNPKFRDADKLGGIFGGLEWDAFWGLGFSLDHGLFLFVPVLLLAIPSAVVGLRSGSGIDDAGRESARRERTLQIVSLGSIGGFVLMNASFNGWHGGFCLGPRYLIPSLPFWAVLLAPGIRWLRGRGRAWGTACAALALIGVANMSLLAMRAPTTTFVEEGQRNPLLGYYRDFAAGRLGAQRLSPLRLDGSWMIDGRAVPQRNGALGLAPHDGARAESFVEVPQPLTAQLAMDWQGDLELRVNGAKVETPHHAMRRRAFVDVALVAGDNAISVAQSRGASEDVSIFVLGPQGRVLFPRASRDAPEPRLSGSNVGTQLGLAGVASVLPWFAGMALIRTFASRALRGPQSPST